MTRGVYRETLDGISSSWFIKTSRALKENTYKFRPVRRVNIPKPNGEGLRPLGVGSPRDKVVQQSMRMCMEHVLEPRFLDCSYGFRPKRGCHTALKKVRSWKGVYWMSSPCPNIKYILYLGKGREGDIKKFFDRIDFNVLEVLIKRHFDDPQLLNLY